MKLVVNVWNHHAGWGFSFNGLKRENYSGGHLSVPAMAQKLRDVVKEKVQDGIKSITFDFGKPPYLCDRPKPWNHRPLTSDEQREFLREIFA